MDDTSAFKQRTITLPSGEKVRRVVRPRFRAMLQMLSRGGGDAMVAYDLDRAVRDPRDLEDLIDAKVLYGFDVHSTTGNLKLDTGSDVAMARVLVAMANKSSADTARRVARAARQGAVEGRWYGGSAPYGYRSAGATLEVVPEQAALLREGARRILAGESMYMICRVWNERGEPTVMGAKWRERSLSQALHPFTGLIRCARCGNTMRKRGAGYICDNHQRNGCARSINAAEVTDLIEQAVLAVFATITTANRPSRDGRDGERATKLQELALG
jgi:site-specific DNA recombinase